VKPVLQWQKINGAERYELLVAADSSFTNVVVARTGDAAITSNVWEFGRPLENGATYFWKVRVCAGSLAGDWSAVGSFTTEPAPPASASATLPTTPPTAPAGTSSPPPGDLQVTLPTFTASPQQITIFSPPQTSQTAVTNLPPITNIQLVAPTWALVTGISLLACMVGLLMMLVVLLLKRKP
jgi:hypothetical protein